jgi:hypothetical protein
VRWVQFTYLSWIGCHGNTRITHYIVDASPMCWAMYVLNKLKFRKFGLTENFKNNWKVHGRAGVVNFPKRKGHFYWSARSIRIESCLEMLIVIIRIWYISFNFYFFQKSRGGSAWPPPGDDQASMASKYYSVDFMFKRVNLRQWFPDFVLWRHPLRNLSDLCA